MVAVKATENLHNFKCYDQNYNSAKLDNKEINYKRFNVTGVTMLMIFPVEVFVLLEGIVLKCLTLFYNVQCTCPF